MLKHLLQLRKKRNIQRLKPQEPAQRFENPYFPSKRKKQQKSTKWQEWMKRDGWALGGIIALLTITSWYMLFQKQQFTFAQATIAPTQFIPQTDIQDGVNTFLDDRILGIIPRNTFFTLRTTTLEEHIRNRLNGSFALVSVTAEKTFPKSLNVTIAERIPSVTWITTKEGERRYLVDREGVVTQVVDSADQINTSFPVVRDPNRTDLKLNEQIISKEYVEFLLTVHDRFQPAIDLKVDSYVFPPLTCYKREYVAEKIFQEEILKSTSEEYKEKKRVIQQQLQSGDLSIDQSLEQLEQVKNEELEKAGQGVSPATGFEWRTVYEPKDCDFVATGSDVHVVTSEESGSFKVYMDRTVDLNIQLQHAKAVIQSSIPDLNAIEYIDVRIPDRAYYK